MRKLFILLLSLIITTTYASHITKETIYSGKLDQAKMKTSLFVSNFYAVQLHKDNSTSFQYVLRPNLKNDDLQVGIYKATAFSLLPAISSKISMSLKMEFKQTSPFKLQGEMISFEGDLSIDQTKVGTVKYEFNMYQLPIKRVYNPKVTRSLESAGEGFIIVENREI